MSSKAVTVLECESSSRPHSLEGTTDDERKPLLYSDPVESSDLGPLNWNCHCTRYFVFLCYFKPIIMTQNQFRAKKKEWQLNTDPKAKKLLKAVFCEWSLLHLMRKIKFLAFYVCCFCSHGLAYKQSNKRNETNLLAPLTLLLLLLLFYFFCFNLLSFSFLSIGFTGKNNVVDS